MTGISKWNVLLSVEVEIFDKIVISNMSNILKPLCWDFCYYVKVIIMLG